MSNKMDIKERISRMLDLQHAISQDKLSKLQTRNYWRELDEITDEIINKFEELTKSNNNET